MRPFCDDFEVPIDRRRVGAAGEQSGLLVDCCQIEGLDGRANGWQSNGEPADALHGVLLRQWISMLDQWNLLAAMMVETQVPEATLLAIRTWRDLYDSCHRILAEVVSPEQLGCAGVKLRTEAVHVHA